MFMQKCGFVEALQEHAMSSDIPCAVGCDGNSACVGFVAVLLPRTFVGQGTGLMAEFQFAAQLAP